MRYPQCRVKPASVFLLTIVVAVIADFGAVFDFEKAEKRGFHSTQFTAEYTNM